MKKYDYQCPKCSAADLVFAEYVYTETAVHGVTLDDAGTEEEDFGDPEHDYSDVKPVSKPYTCQQCRTAFDKAELCRVPTGGQHGVRSRAGETARDLFGK